MAKDTECNAVLYETNYNNEIDKVMKQVVTTYTSHITKVNFRLPSVVSDCKLKSYLSEICYIIIIYIFNLHYYASLYFLIVASGSRGWHQLKKEHQEKFMTGP